MSVVKFLINTEATKVPCLQGAFHHGKAIKLSPQANPADIQPGVCLCSCLNVSIFRLISLSFNANPLCLVSYARTLDGKLFAQHIHVKLLEASSGRARQRDHELPCDLPRSIAIIHLPTVPLSPWS